MAEITYRWVDGWLASDADWERIELAVESRGWMTLNKNTTRVLIAERDGEFAFHVFQLVPFCGPLYLPQSMRGKGVAEEMADQMREYLISADVRGWIATAESPFAARLCEARGMKKLETPVYVTENPGGVER